MKTKDYAIGIGVGRDGIAYTADIQNYWLVYENNSFIAGYKLRF